MTLMQAGNIGLPYGNQGYQQQGVSVSSSTIDGWLSMESAPRDGTIVEVRCTYGVAPWYGLFRWTDELNIIEEDGQSLKMQGQYPRWAKIGDDCMGFTEDQSFSWRPYQGNNEGFAYVDPTGGAQDTDQYWLHAAARSIGKPLNYFDPKPSVASKTSSLIGLQPSLDSLARSPARADTPPLRIVIVAIAVTIIFIAFAAVLGNSLR